MAGAGLVVALAVGRLLPRDRASRTADPGAAPRAPVRAVGAPAGRGGFRLLVAIGMLDNAARPAFLIYLPFLMQEKGAALTTVGLALSWSSSAVPWARPYAAGSASASA